MSIKLTPVNEDVVLEIAETAPSDPNVLVINDAKAGSDELPRGATLNDDGSVTLVLRFPVLLQWKTVGSEVVQSDRYDTLTFHRLRGADMKEISKASRDKTIVVGLARSAGISELKMDAVFDRMDGADAGAAGQILSYFLGGGQQTGR